jgi:hypothetical protein
MEQHEQTDGFFGMPYLVRPYMSAPDLSAQVMIPRRETADVHNGDAAFHMDEPIYLELMMRWWMAGRMVPGQSNEEWTRIVAQCVGWPPSTG